MKKYYLNPADIIVGIAFMSLSVIPIIFLIIWLILNSPSNVEQIILACVIFIVLIMILLCAFLYLYKYSGYLYLDDKQMVLKKEKKQVSVDIVDIRWIELKYDTRGIGKGGVSSQKGFRFFIRLNERKTDLDFIITNKIILEIIKKNNIRIMPDWYNQIYLETGNFDIK